MSLTGCVRHITDRSDFSSGILLIRPPIGGVLKGFHDQSASFCDTREQLLLAAHKATEEDEKEENLEAAARLATRLLLSDLDVIFIDLIFI